MGMQPQIMPAFISAALVREFSDDGPPARGMEIELA